MRRLKSWFNMWVSFWRIPFSEPCILEFIIVFFIGLFQVVYTRFSYLVFWVFTSITLFVVLPIICFKFVIRIICEAEDNLLDSLFENSEVCEDND